MRRAVPILLVFALAAFLLLVHLGAPPLDEAEARSAIVSRHILNTGQWLRPVPNHPFTCERSPLVYWQAVPFAWLPGGMTELAVRLPSVLWALALLFFTWGLARRWHDDLTALLSAGALATSYGFIHFGRHGTAEMAQAATILWCLWYFVRHRPDAARRWLYVLGVLLGLAANFGAREAYGVVILGAFVLSAMARDWAWLRPVRTVALALLVSIAVFLALPLAASVATGSSEPLRALWREHALRHLQPPGQAFGWHRELWRLVTFCLPWLVLVPIAALHDLWRWRRGEAGFPQALVLGGAALVWLALSSSREPRHVFVLVPFASIIAGRLLAEFTRKELAVPASGAIQLVLLLAGVAVVALLICGAFLMGPGWCWAAFVAVWAVGVALMAAALTRSGNAALAAVAILWIVAAQSEYLTRDVMRPRRDVRDQVALIAKRGKPVAFVGGVRAPVAFYLNAGYAQHNGAASAQKWAAETGGTVIASRKPDGDSWEPVAEGVSWQAFAWNPQARAVSLTRDPAWLAKHPLRGIKSETLTYVFSAEALARFNLGTVTMRLAREEAKDGPQFVITAESKGGVPGYPMESVVTSHLRESDLAQLDAYDLRTKPSYKHRRFTWPPEGVDYHRYDHCKDNACRNPLHMVKRADGSQAHCATKRCDKMEHRVWRLKEAFRVPGARDAWHAIAACYIARGFDVRPGSPPQLIRVVNNQQMWDVALRAVEEKTIEVPAGKFACYKLGFDATPLNRDAQESADEAEGPFGLTGHADLYVDKATRLLVLLDGQIELGATFKVQVMLTKREAEAMPGARPEGR